jgi:hypothetical protein
MDSSQNLKGAFSLRVHSFKNSFCRYEVNIDKPFDIAKKKGQVIGAGLGLTRGLIYVLFGCAFLYGVDKMLADFGLTAGDILLVSAVYQNELHTLYLQFLHYRLSLLFSKDCFVLATDFPDFKTFPKPEEQLVVYLSSSKW